jgi:hypothetical protein
MSLHARGRRQMRRTRLPREQVLKHLSPIGSRFVAIAVVGGTGERQGQVFENRDVCAMALRITAR